MALFALSDLSAPNVEIGVALLLLRQNHLTTTGAISIAKGLATNERLKSLNLMNQNHKISEEALESFITMFQTNLTLVKLMWKVDSRRTWELSKLITRNVEIGRRKASGSSIQDLLPAKLRSQGQEGESDPPVTQATQAPVSASPTPASAPQGSPPPTKLTQPEPAEPAKPKTAEPAEPAEPEPAEPAEPEPAEPAAKIPSAVAESPEGGAGLKRLLASCCGKNCYPS